MSLLVLSHYLLRLSCYFFAVLVCRLFESLKDYVSKAVISTIDHLGSVTSKVDTFLDENIDEAFETNLRVLCIQQVLKDHFNILKQKPLFFVSLSWICVCDFLWNCCRDCKHAKLIATMRVFRNNHWWYRYQSTISST